MGFEDIKLIKVMKKDFIFIIILSCIFIPWGIYHIVLRKTIAETAEKHRLNIINRKKTYELIPNQKKMNKSENSSLITGIIYILIPIALLLFKLLT